MNQKVDKDQVRQKMLEMIDVLEYDSMRSAGKAKNNALHLHAMHWLLLNVYKPTKVSKEK